MKILLEYKAAPVDGPASGEPDTATPNLNPVEDAPRWSGDVYEQGDETKPDDAYAHLTGDGGVDAWLDRGDDGAIVGWVRDLDGTVYRYSDPSAWAIDVDDAGLKNASGSTPSSDTGGGDSQEETPAEDSGEGSEEPADGESLDGPDAHLDNRDKRFAFEGKSYEIVYSVAEEV